MPEVPKVAVLGPITPTIESAQSDQLMYEKLSPAAQKYAPDEKARQDAFWESEPGSLAEHQAALQLASQYMIMGASRLTSEAVLPHDKKLWSERYTQASSEIYGVPETSVARELMAGRAAQLITASDGTVRADLLQHFTDSVRSFGVEITEVSEQAEEEFKEAAKRLGDTLQRRFSDAYDALELQNETAKINTASVADRFENALNVLAANHDPDWADWIVERNEDKDSLSVEAVDKKIIVGTKRTDVTPSQLKGLFSHEVLLHAQRGVNGLKISRELGTGLPGYLDAEEGMGVFFEYSVTGKVPEKNVDRYIDIALALGQIDGKQHPRNEILDFALTRAYIRNELASENEKKPDEDIKKEVYSHVNRIYRGSLGNEFIGIFTKDITYHQGFIEMGRYVTEELAAGKSPDELLAFILRGKFDPTNRKHLDVIEGQLLFYWLW